MIEEEYMVSANQRSERKIVSKPGEYKISIRYKDGYADFGRGISKEDVDVVQCRNRPRPPCREVQKFPYRKSYSVLMQIWRISILIKNRLYKAVFDVITGLT